MKNLIEKLSELRKDYYVQDKFVLIPNCNGNLRSVKQILQKNNLENDDNIKKELVEKANTLCPYCPENSKNADNLVLSFVVKDGMLKRLYDTNEEENENWSIRVYECKNPIVTTSPGREYSDKPFYREPAYGHDLIVIPTPNHDLSLTDLTIEQWTNLLLVLQDRVRWLYSQKGVTYVAIYASRDKNGNPKNAHPQFHITTFSSIPPVIEKEAKTFQQLMNDHGICPACNTIESEINGPRQLFSTDSFIAMVPWAPTYNFEFWVSPRKHSTFFSKASQKEILDLALVLSATMHGLDRILDKTDFSIAFHISPEKKNSRQIHWHIEVYPIISSWSGLERGFGIFVNLPNPESTAEILGEASRKELARLIGVS